MSSARDRFTIERRDVTGGDAIVMTPKAGHDSVLICLHGLGDTGAGWAFLAEMMPFEKTKYVFPSARSMPVTLNQGHRMPAWFDIYSLSDRSREDKTTILASADRVTTILNNEIERGIAPERIVVAGFSQGGAIALTTGLRFDRRLGGILAMSTWLPLADEYPAAASEAARGDAATGVKGVKVVQCHGDEDMVVRESWGKLSHQKMNTFLTNPSPTYMLFEGMGHSANEEELDAIKSWLGEVFE